MLYLIDNIRFGVKHYAVFGDSVAYGVGASNASLSFRELLGLGAGAVMINAGYNSTTLQNTIQHTIAVSGGATANNGRDTYAARVTVFAPDKVFILYGLNDLRFSDVAFTADLFENDLGEIVDGLVASGISAENIIIGSPSHMTAYVYAGYPEWSAGTVVKHQAYMAKCAAVASAKGTKYVDVYNWMLSHGGDSLVAADGIHPNDLGHAEIAKAFLSVI
jgi:lysophospholipase L1-like esterase